MILALFGLPMQLPRIEAALRDAGSASIEARWVAAMALARADGPDRERAVTALASLAGDPNEDVRAQAIEGLASHARSGDAAASAGAEGWTADPSDLVRCAALSNAEAFSLDADALAARMLADESPAVRATAARLLGLRGNGAAADAIAGLLGDPTRDVRQEAALALSRLGDARGTTVTVEMLGGGGEGASEAAEALGRSGRAIASDALLEVVARRFAPAALKAVAAAALARSGEEAGRGALVRMLGSWRRQTRFAAVHAIAMLPSRGLAACVASRFGTADALEASILVQTLAAIGEELPDESLAAMRGAMGHTTLAPEIAEELEEAVRSLGADAG